MEKAGHVYSTETICIKFAKWVYRLDYIYILCHIKVCTSVTSAASDPQHLHVNHSSSIKVAVPSKLSIA
jgi:hypothetical protein